MSSKVIHPVNAPKSKWCDLTRLNVARQMGFTMLEALVVLAIVGVLASVAVPAYQRASAQAEINNVARQFAQQAESARVMAQTHGAVLSVCPVAVADLNAESPTCLALVKDKPWSAWVWRNQTANGTPVLFRAEAPQTVVVTSSRSGRLGFDEAGQHVDGFANQTIYVKSSNVDLDTTTAEVAFSNQAKITATIP